MFVLEHIRVKDILHIEQLHIPKGRVTCIVGESGGGKSTLLRLLNQMTSHDSGTIRVDGVPVEKIDPVALRRRVIMVPQQPVLFDGTVRDNLNAGFRLTGRPNADDDRLTEVLKAMQLSGKSLADSPEKMSGGEKQRLALARALLLAPEAFLLDEPSSALDEGTEDAVIGRFVGHVKRNGQTLVMVTHAKRMAEQYGDRIVEIRQGRIARVTDREAGAHE